MGGRANPLQDAAAIVGIGQTEIDRQIGRQLRGTSTSLVEGAQACLVTSGECVPTSAIVLRAA